MPSGQPPAPVPTAPGPAGTSTWDLDGVSECTTVSSLAHLKPSMGMISSTFVLLKNTKYLQQIREQQILRDKYWTSQRSEQMHLYAHASPHYYGVDAAALVAFRDEECLLRCWAATRRRRWRAPRERRRRRRRCLPEGGAPFQRRRWRIY